MKHFLLFFIVCLSFFSTLTMAATFEDIEMLYSHDLTVSHRWGFVKGHLAIHPTFQLQGRNQSGRQDLIYAVVRDRLGRAKIATTLGAETFFAKFKSLVEGASPPRVLPARAIRQFLQPRLFTHFRAVEQKGTRLFRLEGTVVFLMYQSSDAGLHWKPEIYWHQTINTRDLSEADIPEKLVVMTRRLVDDFIPRFRQWQGTEPRTEPPHPATSLSITSHHRSLPHWEEEPESQSSISNVANATAPVPIFAERRHALQVGASVGTPAVGNLHLGVWGWGSLPIAAHLSGMYFSPSIRGAQFETGWIFDRQGSYQQSLNLALALFNESRDEESTRFDGAGRGTTQVVHVHETKPFLGATYTAQWGPIRWQAGPSFRIGPGNDQSFRFLIQAGFVPLIPF